MSSPAERIQCDDQSTDSTDSSHYFAPHVYDPNIHFSDVEMLRIAMTFGGGKSDELVVMMGDKPRALAEAFVVKHNLKISSVELIADRISKAIEEYNLSHSNISMQSPSLDDHDHKEERNECDEVMKKQQSNRDSSIQESSQHEPMDLPDSHTSNSMNSSLKVNDSKTPDKKDSLRIEKSKDNVKSPTSLLNHWADVNDANTSTDTVYRDSTFFSPDGKSAIGQSSVEINEIELSPHKNVSFTIESDKSKNIQSDSSSRSLQKNEVVHREAPRRSQSQSNIRDLNLSPIARGKTYANLLPVHKMSSTGSSNEEDSTSLRRPSSDRALLCGNENRDSVNTKSTAKSTAAPTRRHIPKEQSSKSVKSGSANTSPPHTSGADLYNKLKSEWSGGGRRRSVSGNTSSTTSSMREATAQKLSSINGIKQRSTLMVSKAAGGSTIGSTVRQPHSQENDKAMSPKSNRLYDDAFTQMKRRHMLKVKAAKKEDLSRQEQEFRLSRKSKKIMSNMSRKNDDMKVGDRLHEEAAMKDRRKDEKAKAWADRKEILLTDWSCLQCGTFHAVKNLAPEVDNDQSTMTFTCSGCQAVYDFDAIQQSLFRPTNVAKLKGTQDEHESNRVGARGEDIYEYLHANTYLESKKLQLLKESWEDEDEVLTFKPTIPESSKQLLRRFHQSQQKNNSSSGVYEEDEDEAITLNLGCPNPVKKIVVAETGLESYLHLPTAERLSKAETLCRVATPGKKISRHSKEVSKPKAAPKPIQLSETKMEDLFSRLTYEYIEKGAKRDAAIKKMEVTDYTTGEKLFQPKIGHVPSSLYSSAPVFACDKKETIYEKLLRKGSEAKQRAKELKDKVMLKEKNDMEKNFSQPLEKSLSILRESSTQCVEEIFKLLIANQLFFQNHSFNETTIKEGLSTDRIKLTADYLNEVSEKLETFHDLRLDVRTIDPTLVVEEVQALLLDLRALGLKKANKPHSDSEKAVTDDSNFCISFTEFEQMINKCTSQRAGGVGRSYIYAPKPRDSTVKKMLEEEEKECTFQPVIDVNSSRMTVNRNGSVAIEEILNEEVHLKENRLKQVKALVELQEHEQCTFKPSLYKAPKNIMPTYRGQPKQKRSSDVIRNAVDKENHLCDDGQSAMTASTSSTARKSMEKDDPGDSVHERVAQMRKSQSANLGTNEKNVYNVDISSHHSITSSGI